MPRKTPNPNEAPNTPQDANTSTLEREPAQTGNMNPLVATAGAGQDATQSVGTPTPSPTPHRPHTLRTPMIDPNDGPVGQDHERVMKSTGPAKDSLEPALIQPVERPVDKEKLEMLAFMEELVEVYIQPTTNPADEEIFEIFNNGQRELFRRGETKTVRRKFVNELAMRKITTYKQREKVDEQGTRVIVQIPHTALRYPFSVVRDPHPRGADWLKFTLAQP